MHTLNAFQPSAEIELICRCKASSDFFKNFIYIDLLANEKEEEWVNSHRKESSAARD